MIRRTNTFVQQAVSTTIEPSDVKRAPEETPNSTQSTERQAGILYQDGGASLVKEFSFTEQIAQASLQNQFRETGPAPIKKDPSAARLDLPEVIRPNRKDPGPSPSPSPPSPSPAPAPSPSPAPVPPSPGPGPIAKKNHLTFGDKGQEVGDLQRQLNEWRANQNPPLPLIKEDYIFGVETQKAVKEFQKANGLQTDGVAGEKTKERLEIESSPNFRKLDPDIQKQIREKLTEYQKNPDARNHLKQLATDPNFANTSSVTQQELLTRFTLNPNDPDHAKKIQVIAKDLSSMESASADFKNTSPEAKKKAIDRMYQYADDDAVRGNLNKILADGKFTKMPIDQQEKILKVFDIRRDSEISDEMIKIVNSRAWSQMDDTMKNRVLDNLNANAGKVLGVNSQGAPILDTAYTNNLAFLIADPRTKFDQYSKQDKEKALNIFDNCGIFARAPFLSFMQREINGVPAPLKAGAGNTGTTLDQLNQFVNTPLDPRVGTTKEKVMEDLIFELADPAQKIDHGDRHTSSVTIMTRELAEKNPAEYARLIKELATKGQSTLTNGDTISPPADAWQEDLGGRSVGERLLQSALMDYARPGAGYQNWNPGPDGIRGTRDDGFSNGNLDGYSPNGDVTLTLLEGIRVFNGLNGKKP